MQPVRSAAGWESRVQPTPGPLVLFYARDQSESKSLAFSIRAEVSNKSTTSSRNPSYMYVIVCTCTCRPTYVFPLTGRQAFAMQARGSEAQPGLKTHTTPARRAYEALARDLNSIALLLLVYWHIVCNGTRKCFAIRSSLCFPLSARREQRERERGSHMQMNVFVDSTFTFGDDS